ncbi:MAG: alpha/beta fold hydrolase [Thermoleophilia bacterium]|nr:alpha/beta fold hydrolase [Thermoleophilia bacterium]
MGLPVFRSAGDPADPAVLLVHGYPESSHMWRAALGPIAARGLYAVAPDLPGFGDSAPGPGGTNTWERHVEALEALRVAEGLGRVALVCHDWGGLIGLRWACEHPDAVWAVVASDTGFFPDGRWHGLADALRTPGQGEELVDGMTLEAFTGMLGSLSKGIGPEDAREYFKAFADEPRRRGQLELYRSGDWEKLEAYDGALAGLGVPFLALWGEDDPFAPVAGAQRFAREIPGARVQVIPGTGHFVYDDAPETAAEALATFLAEAVPR